jgi:long-chain acyl-CoA synthetase
MLSPPRSRTVALTWGSEEIAYDDLWERVGRFACGLAVRGVEPGDRVALVLPNGPDFVIAFLAVAQLRAVAVPLNPQFKKAELAFYFHDCGVRAVITDEAGAAVCRAIVPRVSPWGEAAEIVAAVDALVESHPVLEPERRSADEIVVVQYSSGSTGRPKQVPRTHGQLRAEVEAYVAALSLTEDDTIFCAIPMFHTYGLGCCLLAAVRSGATLAILDDPGPFAVMRERALALLEREVVTVFPAVPLMFRVLAEAGIAADLSSVRLCLSAGNALPRSVFDAFHGAFGIGIRQLYGLTEAGCVTVNLDGDAAATAASVGRPIRGVELAVLDEGGNDLGTDRIGEIAVRAAGMTRGYAGVEEQLNQQAFRDGWFRTGDRGRLGDDGRLVLTGRKKLLIDVNGDKVDPIEVEDVLAVHPKVREVVVVGVASEIEGEELVKAVVVPDETCSERELIRYCRERLANYKVPRTVEFRDEIPKNTLGKVLRKYLI